MKTFNASADSLFVRFYCPICGELIEADLSDIIPYPYMSTESESDDDNSEVMIRECEDCGATFTIEVYRNFFEGKVSITYHLDNEKGTIKDLELSYNGFDDFYSPTSWEREPDETEEEYQERIQAQEDLLEYYDE